MPDGQSTEFTPAQHDFLLTITSAAINDLLPPGLFDKVRSPKASEPDHANVMVESGYVMLNEEWTGRTSSGGWIPWFPVEMVSHHCALRVVFVLGLMTPPIASHLQVVSELEQRMIAAPASARDDLEREYEKRRHELALLVEPVINRNELGLLTNWAIELLSTDDPAKALLSSRGER